MFQKYSYLSSVTLTFLTNQLIHSKYLCQTQIILVGLTVKIFPWFSESHVQIQSEIPLERITQKSFTVLTKAFLQTTGRKTFTNGLFSPLKENLSLIVIRKLYFLMLFLSLIYIQDIITFHCVKMFLNIINISANISLIIFFVQT